MSELAHPAGLHLPWREVPAAVHDWAIAVLGAPPVEVVDKVGGFSPGACAVLRSADGSGRFVKAVSSDPNGVAPRFHRREARISAFLPQHVHLPKLLDHYDDGDWIALLFEEVPGALPPLPWEAQTLDRVLAAIATLHEVLTPSPALEVEAASESLTSMLGGWARLAGSRREAALDPWARENLDRLVALELPWPEAISGHTLIHGDLRSDNMLVTASNVVFIDWPHACRAAPCFDLIAWAPTVVLEGGPLPEELLAGHPSLAGVDADAVTCLVAALAGFFFAQGTLPAQPGLPGLREFQLAQGDATLAWLRRRLAQSSRS